MIKVDARDLWVTPGSMQGLTLQPPVTPSAYRSATGQEQQEEIQRADQKDPNSQREGSSVFCLQGYQGPTLEAFPGVSRSQWVVLGIGLGASDILTEPRSEQWRLWVSGPIRAATSSLCSSSSVWVLVPWQVIVKPNPGSLELRPATAASGQHAALEKLPHSWVTVLSKPKGSLKSQSEQVASAEGSWVCVCVCFMSNTSLSSAVSWSPPHLPHPLQ